MVFNIQPKIGLKVLLAKNQKEEISLRYKECIPILLFLLFVASSASAAIVPEIAITAPTVTGTYISPAVVAYTVTWDVNYADWNGLLDANIGLAITQNTTAGDVTEVIVTDDTNASTYCAGGGDYSTSRACTYSWTTAPSSSDGNYMFDINFCIYYWGSGDTNQTVTDRSDANFYLDQTVPTLAVSPANGQIVTTAGITYNFTASDAGVIKEYYYSIGDVNYSNGTTATYTYTLDAAVRLPASQSFVFWVMDLVDNNSEVTLRTANFESATGGRLVCGDAACANTETAVSCPADCPAVCGDGACTHSESSLTCAEDCGVACGDGRCDAAESCKACAEDCGACKVTPEEKQPEKVVTPLTEVIDKCAGIVCNDRNPCTTDTCIAADGSCSYVPLRDGTTCGFGKACKAGNCIAAAAQSAQGEGTIAGLDTTTVGIVVVVVVVLAGAYYFLIAKK